MGLGFGRAGLWRGVFSGEKDNKPVGIYRLSLSTGNLTHLLEGHYLTPFVCDSGKTLYFSWGPSLQSKTPAGDAWPTFNDFSGLGCRWATCYSAAARSTPG